MRRISLIPLCLLLSCGLVHAQDLRVGFELPQERTYNQKVFDLGQGEKRHRIHVGHINYKDAEGNFQEIDTRLSFKDGSWQQEKASWHGKIPEYANGWFEFVNRYEGNNHTIKARPGASHVEGTLITNGEWPNKQVLYEDAFGAGMDLRVTARPSGLAKEVIVIEKPAVLQDLHFDFEILLEGNADRIYSQKEASILRPDLSAVDITGDTIVIGKDGGSFMRKAKVWDSAKPPLMEMVGLKFVTQSEKLILRKTIGKKFLEDAVFPVYTDHPTNYYVGVGDGQCAAGTGAWDYYHDLATGSSADYTSTVNYVGCSGTSGAHNIYRAFFPTDTSAIDDGATITAATLYVKCDNIGNLDDDGENFLTTVQTSQANTSELVTADYDQCGAVDDPTEGNDNGDREDMDGISAGNYFNIPLNATGIGWIDKTGVTKLGLREGHDALDSASANHTYVGFRSSEYANTGSDPYLDVTVGAAAGPKKGAVMVIQ